MLPPQAPPAIVSPATESTREAIHRLKAFQSWLLGQQDMLPDPYTNAQDRERFLAHIDHFWTTSVDTLSRRDAFAQRLAQAMRDAAWVSVGEGWLSRDSHDLVRQLTEIGAGPSSHVHAGELMVGDTPYPGALVAWDDDRPDDILLFTPHDGWDSFDSLDDLFADMQVRMRGHDSAADDIEYGDDGTPHSLMVRPLATSAVETVTDGLIVHFRALLDEAWMMHEDPVTRVDALHATLRLFMLIDPHTMLATLGAPLAFDTVRNSPRACSPPARLTGNLARGATRHLGVTGGRIAKHATHSLTRRVGTRLPGRLPSSRASETMVPSSTLFNERYVAHGVVIPEGTTQVDGVFLIGNARYIRQGDQVYGVRYDTSLHGWRLQHPGALDPQYAGPPIKRTAEGTWQVWQDAGLLGGGPRRHVPAWEVVDGLTAEQIRLLQAELRDRLGHDEGLNVFRRMAARPPAHGPAPRFSQRHRQAWNRSVEVALDTTRTVTPTARPLSGEVAALSANELAHLQLTLNERLGYIEGLQAFHELAYPRPPSLPGPSVSPNAMTIWKETLATIQARRVQAGAMAPPPPQPLEPTRLRTADVTGLSRSQLERLRWHLRTELGNPRGTALYQNMAYEPLHHAPAPVVSDAERALWERVLAEVHLPPNARRLIVAAELADLGRHQLSKLRKRLINTLGEERGVAVYETRALTATTERTSSMLSSDEIATWERLLASARAKPYRQQPGPSIAGHLADLSSDELFRLRIELKRRLGFHHGEELYIDRIRRPSAELPTPAMTELETTTWHEALAMIRGARNAAPPPAMAADEIAGRLWHVPESEWPEVAYFYAPASTLETVSEDVLLVAQTSLDSVGVNGIPLFTAPPSTPVNQVDALASSWLPDGPSGELGALTGAWLRIDLRAATQGIRPSFDLFRLGSAPGHAFVLRPTSQSASTGTGERALWLFGHHTTHLPTP